MASRVQPADLMQMIPENLSQCMLLDPTTSESTPRITDLHYRACEWKYTRDIFFPDDVGANYGTQMINLGSSWELEHWPDNWTAVTADGKRSAQFEETLL